MMRQLSRQSFSEGAIVHGCLSLKFVDSAHGESTMFGCAAEQATSWEPLVFDFTQCCRCQPGQLPREAPARIRPGAIEGQFADLRDELSVASRSVVMSAAGRGLVLDVFLEVQGQLKLGL